MNPVAHATSPTPSSYRYLMIAVSFMTLAGASGASSAFAVFYPELLKVFGWSHASGALVYSVNMLVVAISSPLLGWLLDRFGPRWLFSAAAIMIGLAFGACSRVSSLGQYAFYYGILSALGQTALLSTTVVVAKWFAQAQRGRAIGVADVGTGFGMVALAPRHRLADYAIWLADSVHRSWHSHHVGARTTQFIASPHTSRAYGAFTAGLSRVPLAPL